MKVFAATEEDAKTLGEDAEWVNHGVCPKCGELLAHAETPMSEGRGTHPHTLDDYTVWCNHGDETAEMEAVTPIWSVV